MNNEITVAELIKILQNVVNQNKPVRIWNCEYSAADPIDYFEDCQDEFVMY